MQASRNWDISGIVITSWKPIIEVLKQLIPVVVPLTPRKIPEKQRPSWREDIGGKDPPDPLDGRIRFGLTNSPRRMENGIPRFR